MTQHHSTRTETASAFRERLGDLEARVAALESTHATSTSGDFWVIDHIKSANSFQPGTGQGSVAFGGAVTLGGREYAYQWERSTEFLAGREWDEYIDRIAAIAHPVRAAILRRLLSAPTTVAELVEESVVSSTGTGYHHIGALHDAGWISKLDGRYEIRPSRVIPLLTIIASGEDH